MSTLISALGALGVESLAGWEAAVRAGLAAMLLVGASGHVGKRRADLVAMVPPDLPRPDLLVAVAGVIEVALAVGLLIGPVTAPAAIAMTVLMITLFPANIRAARHSLQIGGRPATPLVPRALVQAVFAGLGLALAIA